MSAWLCRNKTLSLCVDVIKGDDFKEYAPNYHNKSKEELFEILADLNTKSLNCRYGKSKSHILQDREYESLDVSNAQKHKTIGFYTYQTCECDENLEHPLFKALEKWFSDNNEKYEESWGECHWDIDSPYY